MITCFKPPAIKISLVSACWLFLRLSILLIILFSLTVSRTGLASGTLFLLGLYLIFVPVHFQFVWTNGSVSCAFSVNLSPRLTCWLMWIVGVAEVNRVNHWNTTSRNGQASRCRHCCASRMTEADGRSSHRRHLSEYQTTLGRRGYWLVAGWFVPEIESIPAGHSCVVSVLVNYDCLLTTGASSRVKIVHFFQFISWRNWRWLCSPSP